MSGVSAFGRAGEERAPAVASRLSKGAAGAIFPPTYATSATFPRSQANPTCSTRVPLLFLRVSTGPSA